MKLVIDEITRFDPERIGMLCIMIVGIFGANQIVSIIDFFTDKRIFRLICDAEYELLVGAQKKMVFLDLYYHEKENTGNKITKIQKGVDKIIDLLGNTSWDVVPTLVQIVLTTILLFIIDWRFGFIFIFFVPLFVVLTLRLNRLRLPYRKMRHDRYEKASGKMAQSIININTVKSFVREKWEVKTYRKIAQEIRKNWLIEVYYVFRYNLGRNFIVDAGRIAVLAFGIYSVWKGSLTIGSLVFIVTISEKAFISLFRISRLYDRIMDSSEAISRLSILEKEEPMIKNPKNGIIPGIVTGQIRFRNVDFTYKEGRGKALDDVFVEIPAGCTTALVGPSGGGKTTLARMIYRHYDPQKGTVFLDDVDLRRYDLYAFRKNIAIVPQEVEMFNTTVWENIAYANPKANIKEIKAVARIANAEEFISKLKDGYNTLVGERGIKLSGGQRQRIGIARAILANPKILIFDEATSNLDSYSEFLIQRAMKKAGKGRTVIVIAHRFSTIKEADKIIVLEKGKVVETGSHYELATNRGGVYAKLLSLQEMGSIVD